MKVQQERRKEETVKIKELIDIRCEAIQGELKHMINSLLGRPSNKVKVDRVLKIVGERKILLTEEKEVLNEVRTHFIK
jgi:hypothetical protein